MLTVASPEEFEYEIFAQATLEPGVGVTAPATPAVPTTRAEAETERAAATAAVVRSRRIDYPLSYLPPGDLPQAA